MSSQPAHLVSHWLTAASEEHISLARSVLADQALPNEIRCSLARAVLTELLRRDQPLPLRERCSRKSGALASRNSGAAPTTGAPLCNRSTALVMGHRSRRYATRIGVRRVRRGDHPARPLHRSPPGMADVSGLSQPPQCLPAKASCPQVDPIRSRYASRLNRLEIGGPPRMG